MPDLGLMHGHGVVAVNSKHKDVRRLKRLGYIPSIHGTKVWLSSFALMEYFEDFPIPDNVKVMDVGCGWCIMGIYLAKTFNADVLALDADPNVAPYIALQAQLNNVDIPFRAAKLQQITQADFNGFDTVIAADVCFWDDLTKPLYNMIRRALRAGVRQIIIADPGRPPFWALTELCDGTVNAEVHRQTTDEPKLTTKHLLIIEQ